MRAWAVGVCCLIGAGLLCLSAGSLAAPRTAGYPALLAPPPWDDGFDRLPLRLQALSMGSLVARGLVHPDPGRNGRSEPARPLAPLSDLVWGPAVNMSVGTDANEPAAAMHPTNPLLGLSAGNRSGPAANGVQINNTTDGGVTWQQRPSPWATSGGDGAVTWLADGTTALAVDVNTSAVLRLSASTDSGVNWAAVTNTNLPLFGWTEDREYLWTDQLAASPYHGRVYVTEALLNGDSSYFTVGARWSSDGGTTWSPFAAWADPGEFIRGENHNEYPALAMEPDGTVVGVWHRGRCCGPNPTLDVPNKVMWARSTDGGTSFPLSGTITTVPVSQSIAFNATAPPGFRWSDAPNVAADPVDGTLYAVWAQMRTPNDPGSAAIYLARGAPDATTWQPPVLVYDSPNPELFQYFPWVQVSADHVVHVTFSAAVDTTPLLGHFYVQSTDGGQTFSVPFQLSSSTYGPAGFMGDYEGMSVGGISGPGAGNEALLATWTENHFGTNQWGRIGTFALGTPTPTMTGTPPTATPTPSPPATATSCPTNGLLIVAGQLNGDYDFPELDDIVRYAHAQASPSLPDRFAIFQVSDPWGHTYLKDHITADGYQYTVFTPADLATVALSDYRVVVLNWDGATVPSFQTPYEQALPRLEDYVRAGGVLWIQTATLCSGTCGASFLLPFGATATFQAFTVNYIVDPTSPMIQGMSNPFGGQTVSTGRFGGLAATAHVVVVGGNPSGLPTLYEYRPPVCSQPPPTATPAGATATSTAAPSASATGPPVSATPTRIVPTATRTQPPPSATPCGAAFSDVHPTDYFYGPVLYLACHGVVSGYADGTFRPYADTTRAQMVKIVVLGFAVPIQTPGGGAYTFADVPPAAPFFAVIETAAGRGIVGGYACGGVGEPCDLQHRPYFRPNSAVTRGHVAKIDAGAAGWTLLDPPGATFADVAPGSAFYRFVETAACHSVVSGYACGGSGEPCDAQRRPYYRQYNSATRGQIAKIVYLSLTAGGSCPP